MSFYQDYFEEMSRNICGVSEHELIQTAALIRETQRWRKKVMLVGNGGSASIASHLTIDLTKNAGIRAVNFNDPSIVTGFANDCGYENWLDMAIGYYGDEGDLLVAISSSGSSRNILKAVDRARSMGIRVVTFSGFRPDNPLRQLGDVNFYVGSEAYNVVEMAHHVWLVALVDDLVGKTVYSSTENVGRFHEALETVG